MRRAALDRFGGAAGFLIGINGSYARREATHGSDVDLFFLATGSDVSLATEKQGEFRKLLRADLNLKLPASGGVFEKPLPVDNIYEIGGLNDDNATLTRSRLIKLRFSRMLLYASGVLAIGEGYGLSSEEKLKSLQALLERPPIGRIRSIVGEKAEPVLDLYADFLRGLDTAAVRQALEEEQNSEVFEDLSGKARRFRDRLHCLFDRHFCDDNPTLRAVLL